MWAVALDAYDAFAARDAGKGFVPGRSFVGKVVEWGDGVKGFSKGDWVFGLCECSWWLILLFKNQTTNSVGLDWFSERQTIWSAV